MKHIITYLSVALIISGCIRVPAHKEFAEVKKDIEKTNQQEISWPRQEKENLPSAQETEKSVASGLTRQQAIEIALKRNPSLQAQFEELGIRTAQLVDAGLLTNPGIAVGASWPKNRTASTQTPKHLSGSVLLSDIWNVPAKYAVADDNLWIKKFEVTEAVITLIRDVKNAYNDCVFAYENLELTKEIVRQMTKLRDKITASKKAADFDKYYANVTVGRWEIEVYKGQFLYENAILELRRVLNLEMRLEPFVFLESLELNLPISTVDALETLALQNQPTLKRTEAAIDRAQHTIALEKAKIFNDVTFNAGWRKNTDGESSRGISFETSVPIFNPKNARIAGARYELFQAEQNYNVELIKIKKDVYQQYAEIMRRKNELKLYKESIIPNTRLATAQKINGELGKESAAAIITAYIDLYQVKRDRISTSYNLAKAFNELEKVVGMKLF